MKISLITKRWVDHYQLSIPMADIATNSAPRTTLPPLTSHLSHLTSHPPSLSPLTSHLSLSPLTSHLSLCSLTLTSPSHSASHSHSHSHSHSVSRNCQATKNGACKKTSYLKRPHRHQCNDGTAMLVLSRAHGRQAACCHNLRSSNHASSGNAHCSQFNFCSREFWTTPALAVERTQIPAESHC